VQIAIFFSPDSERETIAYTTDLPCFARLEGPLSFISRLELEGNSTTAECPS
jgi:hypothetical protein